MKLAKGTAHVRRFAAYVKDGADNPEQALMEVTNSHPRYPEDSFIALSCFEQRAAVHQAASQATAGDADQTDFQVTELAAIVEATAATPASRRRIGTDLRLRTNLTTLLIADTGQP
jgi:hypothetical protein